MYKLLYDIKHNKFVFVRLDTHTYCYLSDFGILIKVQRMYLPNWFIEGYI